MEDNLKDFAREVPVAKTTKKKKKKYMGMNFLMVVIFIYIIFYFFYPQRILDAMYASGLLLIKIGSFLWLLVVIMGIADHYSDPGRMKRLLGTGSGVKGWVIAIVSGIISAGPIFIWYPFLSDMKKKGMKNSLIAVFLYNRAIKIPLIPILVYYFSFKFVLIMLICMIAASVLEGLLMDFIFKPRSS